jgi:hypothetical protein
MILLSCETNREDADEAQGKNIMVDGNKTAKFVCCQSSLIPAAE